MRKITVTEYRPAFQPSYLANGLVGLRIGSNPLVGGKALLNGFVGRQATVSHEGYNPAPYPLGGNVIVGTDQMLQRPDLLRFVEQSYDFSCGELTTRLHFAAENAGVDVEILTFCSRTLPPVAAQELRLTVDRPCRLTFEARMDPQGLPGRPLLAERLRWCADAVLWWEGRGKLSSCGAAYDCEFLGADATVRRNDWGLEQDMQLTAFAVEARPGSVYVCRQFGALVPSIMHSEPHWQAARLVEAARVMGFDELRAANRAAWKELWRARPVLVGAEPRWQDAADAAFFYLHSSVHPSMPASVAPFGLSDELNYHGHIFWDTEGWMFPATLMTDPESARAMLDYRSRLADAARWNARLWGRRGLDFPCQTANSGSDVTTLWAKAAFGGGAGLGVAKAFARYVYATGDRIFEREQAWPILRGVAEWIVSSVRHTRRGYEMPFDRSADEQWLWVQNSATTLWHMREALRDAAAMAGRLGYEAPALWREVAERLYFPIDPRTKVLLKFEGWEDTRELCGMEVLTLYTFTDGSIAPDVDRSTIDYYLDRAGRYLGMPMFSIQLAVPFACYRSRAAATDALEKGWLTRLRDPFLQICECSKAMGSWNSTDVTLFLTATASVTHTMLWLMPGIQWGPGEPATWCVKPPALPDAWEAIEVERLWVRGKPARLIARHGEPAARFEFLDEPVLPFSEPLPVRRQA